MKNQTDRPTEGDDGSRRGRLQRYSKTFSSLKIRNYRLFYGALIGQMAAMNMQLVARGFLVYDITGSEAILGVMALASSTPMLLLSLFGGVIAERVHKKYVMLIGQAGSALVALGIAVALYLDLISSARPNSWWILVVASALQGTIMGLMMPSRQAILPELVGGEQLLNAISLNVMGMNFFRIMAPALAGFLIDAFGYKAVYVVMTGLYIMAVVFVSLLPVTGKISVPAGGVLADMKEGLKYISREKTILFILVFMLVGVVLSFPYMMMMPVFAVDVLKVGASGMGFLMSASGVGAIIGSLVLASLPNRKRGVMFLGGTLLVSVALVGFSISHWWYVSLILIMFVGLGSSARQALGNTLVQYYTDDAYRGRVMSIYMMNFGLNGIGVFGVGLLAEAIGVQWSIGGFAALLAVISILVLMLVPRLRKLD